MGVWTQYRHIREKGNSSAYLTDNRDNASENETNHSTQRERTNQYTLSGNYTHKGEADEFSTAFTFINNHISSRDKQTSDISDASGDVTQRYSLYHNKETGRTYKWRADYYYRFREQKDKWEIGTAYTLWEQNNRTLSKRLTGNTEDAYGNYNDHYRYREQVAAAYTSYDYKIDSRWNVKAGVRVEHLITDPKSSLMETNRKWKQHHTDWFPHAAVNWTIDEKHGHILNINYTRNINRPSLSYLNPALIWNSEYNYSVGNPLLTPTYSHNFEIRNTFFNNYTWGASYTTGASTSFKYFSVENSNITYSTPVTDGDYKSLNSYIAWNPHAKDYSWMVNVMLSYSYQELHSDEQTTRSHSFVATLNGNFKLWKKYSLYISGFYQSPRKSFNSKKGHSLMLMPSLERKFDALTVRVGSNFIINATTEVETDSYRMKFSPKWNSSDIYLELAYNIEWGNKRAFIRNTVESTISETDRMTK